MSRRQEFLAKWLEDNPPNNDVLIPWSDWEDERGEEKFAKFLRWCYAENKSPLLDEELEGWYFCDAYNNTHNLCWQLDRDHFPKEQNFWGGVGVNRDEIGIWLEKLAAAFIPHPHLGECKCNDIKQEVLSWMEKQGHDKCWFYPDIFRKIAQLLEIEAPPTYLPPKGEFLEACERYHEEEDDRP